MVPTAVGWQTGSDGGEGGFIRHIGDDTRFEAVSVGGEHVELEAQLVGGVLKRRQHQNGRTCGTAAHVEAFAAAHIDRGRVVDIGIGSAVGVNQIPAEYLAGEGDRRGRIRQAIVRLKIFRPRKFGVSHFYARSAEAGTAGCGLRAVGAVGEDLHRVAGVGGQGRVGDGLGVDDDAVNQRVAFKKHYCIVIQIGGVGDVYRGAIGGKI